MRLDPNDPFVAKIIELCTVKLQEAIKKRRKRRAALKAAVSQPDPPQWRVFH